MSSTMMTISRSPLPVTVDRLHVTDANGHKLFAPSPRCSDSGHYSTTDDGIFLQVLLCKASTSFSFYCWSFHHFCGQAIMCRSPSSEKKEVLKKGPWAPEEDQKLVAYIQQHGQRSWRELPSKAGLERCGRSCRLRWTNYLRPGIKRGKLSLQEERTIIQLHAFLGNRWSVIAAQLPKRTDNEIKNYWNTHLKKRLTRMGIDPTTHKPITQVFDSTGSSHSNLSHMAQWESARLEAEARLRESKIQLCSFSFPSSQQLMARLVIKKISPGQNSWSCPLTANDRNNTQMHDMYALMLSEDDDNDREPPPTSALSFSEKGENLLTSVTLPNSAGERFRTTNLEDDDIMVAVKAFMHVSKV